MIVAGKCPPEAEALSAAEVSGFRNVELYLTPSHLDDLDHTLTEVQSSSINIVSVHTPHICLQKRQYISKADSLAETLGAYLVVHSQFLIQTHIPTLENLNLQTDHGYENIPGASRHHIEQTIINQGHHLVLDTAHLFMAEPEFRPQLSNLLNKHSNEVRVIHLCDSTFTQDGLAFGKGEMDIQKTTEIIADQFDGIVVLEVPQEYQSDARSRFQRWIDE